MSFYYCPDTCYAMLTNKDNLDWLSPAGHKLMWCDLLVQVLFYIILHACACCECPAWDAGCLGTQVFGSELWHLMMVLGSCTAAVFGSSGPCERRGCSATTAEGWGFLPPWSPRSVKPPAGSTSPVGSGLGPGKFLFLMWKVSSQTLKLNFFYSFIILGY